MVAMERVVAAIFFSLFRLLRICVVTPLCMCSLTRKMKNKIG